MSKTHVMGMMAILLAGTSWAREAAVEPVMIVATGVGESAAVSPAVPEADRRPALAMAWQALGRMAGRKAHGVARTLHRSDGRRTWIEWKGLRVAEVTSEELSDSDRLNGVSRRYTCVVEAEAHRVWQSDRISWSDWKAGDYDSFPRKIGVCLVRGRWIAESEHAGEFIAPGHGGCASTGNGIVRVPGSSTPLDAVVSR